MSELTTLPNPQRIPLGKLLVTIQQSLPTLTQEAIRSARYRARKTGRPDPHPYAIRESGVPYPLADLTIYNEVARIKGWPLVRAEEMMRRGGAR